MSQPRHRITIQDKDSVLEKIHYILFVLLEPRTNLGNNRRSQGLPFNEYCILDKQQARTIAEQDRQLFNLQIIQQQQSWWW